jgi:hypothetical protein
MFTFHVLREIGGWVNIENVEASPIRVPEGL